jgi:16S rRNA (guanine966-N2)-methyltransferase
MAISILGGMARGFSLDVPKGALIRPTSVRLKRRLFDANQNLYGYTLIDLCAGSGAIGLEAWSRGADEVYLIEKNPKVFGLLKKNTKGVKDRFSEEEASRSIHLSKADGEKWLKSFKEQYLAWGNEKKEHTIVFVDPPYEQHGFYRDVVFGQLTMGEWYRGLIWIESDRQKGLDASVWEELPGHWSFQKKHEQGSSYIVVVSPV